MDKQRSVVEKYRQCDGCQYLVGKDSPVITVSVPLDHGEFLFHFHTLANRHDCFRYWAHSPRIMQKSLQERSFTDEMIDEFLELMLYREDTFHPGIARPAS